MIRSLIFINYIIFANTLSSIISQVIYNKEVYTSSTLDCPCNTLSFSKMWFHNGSEIQKRPGKYIFQNNHLEILDLRFPDSGLYTCVGLKLNCSVKLNINKPQKHFLEIHNGTVPLEASLESPDKIYWHPKMKREKAMLYYDFKPINASVYFYTQANITPNVLWIRPDRAFSEKGYAHMPELLDCNAMIETQRFLTGFCYRASFTIQSLSESEELGCEISANNTVHLFTRFTILRNANDRISLNPSDFEESIPKLLTDPSMDFEISNDHILDEFRRLMGTTTKPQPSTPTVNISSAPLATPTSSITPHHTAIHPLSLLNKSSSLDFVSTSPFHCKGGNLTLRCHRPGSKEPLEIWYIGQHSSSPITASHGNAVCLDNGSCYHGTPVLLKVSQNQTYFIKSKNGRVTKKSSFSNTVSLTLIDLNASHLGSYLCKYDRWYRLVEVRFSDCVDQGDHWPLIVLLIALCLSICAILVPLMICVKARRKPIIAVISKSLLPGDRWPKSTKKLHMFTRFNPIYSPLTVTNCETQPLLSSTGVNKHSRSRTIRRNLFWNTKPRRQVPFFPYRLDVDPSWEIARSRIRVYEVIDEGNFSTVYRGSLLDASNCFEHQRTVAIKALRRDYNERHLIDLVRELEFLKILNGHPNIIKLLGACTQHGSPMIIQEFASNGNLRDFLRRYRPLTMNPNGENSSIASLESSLELKLEPNLVSLDQQILLCFARQVASALSHLHSLKLIHRDIAARNILVTNDYTAKLCDFGFTCSVQDGDVNEHRDQLPYRWIALECFDGNHFSPQSDVWSFGVLLWELFTFGNTPYPGLSTDELQGWLAAGNRNLRPAAASLAVYALMLRCWNHDPSLRPDAEQLSESLEQLVSDCVSNSSNDTGFVSGGGFSRQTSQTDSSTHTPNRKPQPPIRTCSLPRQNSLPKGYVEIRCHDYYLQPRSNWSHNRPTPV